MAAEIRHPRAVLACRPGANAVVQDRLQRIELGSADVAMLVDDNAGNPLARAARHDPHLCGIEQKTLFSNDGLDCFAEAAEPVCEPGIAGKRQVIGISRVIRARGSGQSVQPAVERPGKEVGECG